MRSRLILGNGASELIDHVTRLAAPSGGGATALASARDGLTKATSIFGSGSAEDLANQLEAQEAADSTAATTAEVPADTSTAPAKPLTDADRRGVPIPAQGLAQGVRALARAGASLRRRMQNYI